jgi:hypothetical protein
MLYSLGSKNIIIIIIITFFNLFSSYTFSIYT